MSFVGMRRKREVKGKSVDGLTRLEYSYPRVHASEVTRGDGVQENVCGFDWILQGGQIDRSKDELPLSFRV